MGLQGLLIYILESGKMVYECCVKCLHPKCLLWIFVQSYLAHAIPTSLPLLTRDCGVELVGWLTIFYRIRYDLRDSDTDLSLDACICTALAQPRR
jgi:hypothetical protein